MGRAGSPSKEHARAGTRTTLRRIPRFAKERSASVKVTARCPQMEPVEIHCQTRISTSLGRLKKNLSRSFAAAPHSQARTNAKPSAICHTRIAPRRLLAGPFIALEHLLAEIPPDRAEQLGETRLHLDIDQISRARQIHGIASDRAARRPGR